VEGRQDGQAEIPVYCYHTKFGAGGTLPHLPRRHRRDAETADRLQHRRGRGMVVRTRGERVEAARAMVLELFFGQPSVGTARSATKAANAICKTTRWRYARGNSDVADPKLAKPKGGRSGPRRSFSTEERCVVLSALRSLRRTSSQANGNLVVKDRGARDIIATASGRPYRHNFTGNVTELCPVGALTSKTYRFKSRPWIWSARKRAARNVPSVAGSTPTCDTASFCERCSSRKTESRVVGSAT